MKPDQWQCRIAGHPISANASVDGKYVAVVYEEKWLFDGSALYEHLSTHYSDIFPNPPQLRKHYCALFERPGRLRGQFRVPEDDFLGFAYPSRDGRVVLYVEKRERCFGGDQQFIFAK